MRLNVPQVFVLALAATLPARTHDESYCGLDERFEQSAELDKICLEARSEIGFPGFSVVDAYSRVPVIETKSVSTCMAVVIYDWEEGKGLLAHFLSGEDTAFAHQLPRASYIQYFRERYFPSADSKRLRILLVKGEATPAEDFEEMQDYIVRDFPQAELYIDDQVVACSRRAISFDVRNGAVTISDISAHTEQGWIEPCIPYIVGDWATFKDLYTGDADGSSFEAHLEEEAYAQTQKKPIQVRRWNLSEKSTDEH